MNSHSRKGVAQVSVSDALQLMFMFGTFIVALLALVVELIKNQQKKITALALAS
ncbi:holin (plasmid) [Leuconostoc mesenteroides]|nr:holin [Leuconostoc mesenteroides]